MSRHLLIAGTGRAGTSFLVRYLTQLGLDTHLSRFGSSAAWDDRANAGLENVPLGREEDLPYVIKSPFTYQLIHDMLARKTYEFDAVVIPMRDLVEAAASRSIVEMQAMHRSAPWMTDTSSDCAHASGENSIPADTTAPPKNSARVSMRPSFYSDETTLQTRSGYFIPRVRR